MQTPRILPALWLALLSADRIDLLGGAAEFSLTPFLALTPLLLGFEVVRIALLRERIRVPPGARAYMVVLGLLLAVVLTSALIGIDIETSARRSVLLVAQSTLTLLVALVLITRRDLFDTLVLGAQIGLAIAVIFTIGGILSLTSGGDLASVSLGTARATFDPFIYVGFFPRFSGQVADPNRGGMLFVFYLYCLGLWCPPGARRRAWISLGVLLLLLTLSRSAVLAAMVTGLAAVAVRRQFRLPAGGVAAGAAAVAVFATALMLTPGLGRTIVESSEPITYRFSLREVSGQIHAELLVRGIEESTSSVRRTLAGVGYGNSFHLLQDYFPGDEYGNFHILYVALWVESGIFALLLVLGLLLVPLLRPGPFQPLVAGMVVFNLFYQSHAEPVFWLTIAMAWLLAEQARRHPADEPALHDARSPSPEPAA